MSETLSFETAIAEAPSQINEAVSNSPEYIDPDVDDSELFDLVSRNASEIIEMSGVKMTLSEAMWQIPITADNIPQVISLVYDLLAKSREEREKQEEPDEEKVDEEPQENELDDEKEVKDKPKPKNKPPEDKSQEPEKSDAQDARKNEASESKEKSRITTAEIKPHRKQTVAEQPVQSVNSTEIAPTRLPAPEAKLNRSDNQVITKKTAPAANSEAPRVVATVPEATAGVEAQSAAGPVDAERSAPAFASQPGTSGFEIESAESEIPATEPEDGAEILMDVIELPQLEYPDQISLPAVLAGEAGLPAEPTAEVLDIEFDPGIQIISLEESDETELVVEHFGEPKIEFESGIEAEDSEPTGSLVVLSAEQAEPFIFEDDETTAERRLQPQLPAGETQAAIVYLAEKIEAVAPEKLEALDKIIDRITEISAHLEADSEAAEEIGIAKEPAAAELEELAQELVDFLDIQLESETAGIITGLIIQWRAADEIQKTEIEQWLDEVVADYGTRELIKGLLIGRGPVHKTFAHSALGSTALQLFLSVNQQPPVGAMALAA